LRDSVVGNRFRPLGSNRELASESRRAVGAYDAWDRQQQIRFCAAPDGRRLAYAVHGAGPPIVRAATWLTHLDFDWESPIWRHWWEGLAIGHTVVRYDERGCGLSDRELGDLSLDTWVGDIQAVADAAELDRFALLGTSAAVPVAVAYAARYPERVSHLVVWGGFLRGRKMRGPEQRRLQDAFISVLRAGWSDPNPAFRRLFTMLFLPEGTPEQMAWYDELQRRSTTGEIAARLSDARARIDVTALAPRVRARTLVMHARDDRLAPVEEGQRLAALIPNARFVLLDSPNHLLLADEPAWQVFLSELRAFLGTERRPAHAALEQLSPREVEVLELVAAGLTNVAIAERLCLSVRTVERHLSNLYAKMRVSGKAGRAAAAASFSRREGPYV
jgi:pimeloyl-ACP methyl ester carboxylesterase/DNA-binding CsgD family transcriptional regulator